MSNPIYTAAQRAAAQHFSSPEDRRIFLRQMGQESGFKQGLTSSAGAQGPAQIMPATAAAWGVKNPNDPREAYGAAAKHMAQYLKQYGGSWRDALTAYNAGPGRVGGSLPGETLRYISTILGGKGDAKAGALSQGSRGSAGNGTPAKAGTLTRGTPPSVTPGETKVDYTGALTDALLLRASQRHGGGSLLHAMDARIAGGGYTTTTAPQINDGTPPSFKAAAAAHATGRSSGASTAGNFKITGPNPGRIQPEVRKFIARLAGIAGHTVVGSDGTGHSKMTTSGNISDHYTGNATDIPLAGAQLTKLGQDALIAAGMPEAQARKQTGGLFNLNHDGHRVQIIFNSMIGGNHFNHLHVGVH